MKFLTKINRQYFLTLTVLLVIMSIAGYFVLKIIILNEIKEDINEKEYAIINEIKSQNNTPNIYPIIQSKRISESEIETKSYKTIYLHDEAEDETEPFLEYTNTVMINDHYYLIKLRHSLLESNALIMAISIPLFLLLMTALAVLFFTTKKMNKTVWKDFEINLKEIENFSFNKPEMLALKQTDIEEFNRLNKTVTELTRKLKTDYQSLKEFTENASHEIQTPLSVISLNLEEILQQELPEPVFKQVVMTQNAVKRLSNLNKKLLLLTKINNKQYPVDNEVCINSIIEKKIEEFRPLIKNRNLSVSYNNQADFMLNMNSELADILVNNLLSNAIKHNINNGAIVIEISGNRMRICNTGKDNSLTNSTIFNRFTKENSESYGLGLSIVKQICNTHNLSIQYTKNGKHCFTITYSI